MSACEQAVGCMLYVVSVPRWSSGVAPRACVRVYARVLVPPNLFTYIHIRTAGNPIFACEYNSIVNNITYYII